MQYLVKLNAVKSRIDYESHHYNINFKYMLELKVICCNSRNAYWDVVSQLAEE